MQPLHLLLTYPATTSILSGAQDDVILLKEQYINDNELTIAEALHILTVLQKKATTLNPLYMYSSNFLQALQKAKQCGALAPDADYNNKVIKKTLEALAKATQLVYQYTKKERTAVSAEDIELITKINRNMLDIFSRPAWKDRRKFKPKYPTNEADVKTIKKARAATNKLYNIYKILLQRHRMSPKHIVGADETRDPKLSPIAVTMRAATIIAAIRAFEVLKKQAKARRVNDGATLLINALIAAQKDNALRSPLNKHPQQLFNNLTIALATFYRSLRTNTFEKEVINPGFISKITGIDQLLLKSFPRPPGASKQHASTARSVLVAKRKAVQHKRCLTGSGVTTTNTDMPPPPSRKPESMKRKADYMGTTGNKTEESRSIPKGKVGPAVPIVPEFLNLWHLPLKPPSIPLVLLKKASQQKTF